MLDIFKTFYKQCGLCFHSISENANGDNQYLHHVSTNRFHELVTKKNYFWGDLSDWNGYVKPFVTFDDGYKNLLKSAVPMLEKYRIPAYFFINSQTLNGKLLWRDKIRLVIENKLEGDFTKLLQTELLMPKKFQIYADTKSPKISSKVVDHLLDDFIYKKGLSYKNDLYMSKDELLQLAKVKHFKLGNHTKNHYFLSSLSFEEQETEIVTGHKELEMLGLPISKVFAAPFGNYNSIDKNTFLILNRENYHTLLLTNGRRSVKNYSTDIKQHLKIYNRYLPR